MPSYPVAKQMLRSGRPPRDRSERMIVNNYAAMQLIRERQREQVTPDFICDLHRVLTEDTLDDPSKAGQPQQPEEERVMVYDAAEQVVHEPPPAEQLGDRMAALCGFANGGEVEGFLHPVIRAVLVHFWLSYDHPFVDGNGRTARALFYWSLLNQGYWLSEFLSVSRILRTAPARYGRAFLYSETDDGDTTYFVLFQLSVICRAIDELEAYLERKSREIAGTERLLPQSDLNHRQLALMSHALRHPDAAYTYAAHARSHRVVHQTARTDLLDLESRGLLWRSTRGRTHVFHPMDDLAELLRKAR